MASTPADSVSMCYLDLDWIACMVTYGDFQMRHIRIEKVSRILLQEIWQPYVRKPTDANDMQQNQTSTSLL